MLCKRCSLCLRNVQHSLPYTITSITTVLYRYTLLFSFTYTLSLITPDRSVHRAHAAVILLAHRQHFLPNYRMSSDRGAGGLLSDHGAGGLSSDRGAGGLSSDRGSGVGYCRVDRVGQVDRVGVGQVDRVGVGLVDRVGQVDRVGKLDPVGVGQVDRVGVGQMERVGVGLLDRVGVVQVDRVWVGQMGRVVVNAFKLIVNVLNERQLCWSIDIILQGGDNVQDYYVC